MEKEEKNLRSRKQGHGIPWNDDAKDNFRELLRALLRLAEEQKDWEDIKERDVSVLVRWRLGDKADQLEVSGREKGKNQGTKLPHLAQLVESKCKYELKPSTKSQTQKNKRVDNFINHLVALGLAEEKDSKKNQGYRKFNLLLNEWKLLELDKGIEAEIEENLKWLEQRWDEGNPTKSAQVSSTTPSPQPEGINWQTICQQMLEPQRQLSSNLLLQDEDTKFEWQKIYVPLALVERKKTEKRDEQAFSPETGSRLYEPEYEEKQRFEHEAFLRQILEKGEGKSKGKRITFIGEPGAGKTTLLQDIAFWVLENQLGLPIWISLADLGRSGTLMDLGTYLFETWLSQAFVPTELTEKIREDFTRQIEQGNIWLLLDGVDEVATSGIETLQQINSQLKGWIAHSRILLTCRLNVWQGSLNALPDFETFRLLDFSYPQQVHQFIDNWFVPLGEGKRKKEKGKSGLEEAGERLKQELEQEGKERIRDLVKNPLRLALLCGAWQREEGNLPETKAGLYALFVEQFYAWKSNRFPLDNWTLDKRENSLA